MGFPEWQLKACGRNFKSCMVFLQAFTVILFIYVCTVSILKMSITLTSTSLIEIELGMI